MSNCKTCSPTCFNQVSDGCVYWTGPSIPCVGIQKGHSYDIAVVALAEKLCEQIDQRADLACLLESQDSSLVPIPEAVQALIDRICSLNADQITTDASLFCIGENSSNCSAKLVNKTFNYSFSANDTYTNFNWDLSNAVNALPSGYDVLSSSVIVFGTTGKSNSIISESTKTVGGIRLQPKHFPATAEIKVRVSTPCGTVELNKNIGVINTTDSFVGIFNTKDLTGDKSGSLSVREYQETVASELCLLKTKVERLDDIAVSNCGGLNFPANDFNSILQVLISKVCELEARLADPGSFQVSFTQDCADCGGQSITTSLSGALNSCMGTACNASTTAQENAARIQVISNQNSSTTITGSGGSSLTNGGTSSGGSTTTISGGCRGGNCPQ